MNPKWNDSNLREWTIERTVKERYTVRANSVEAAFNAFDQGVYDSKAVVVLVEDEVAYTGRK